MASLIIPSLDFHLSFFKVPSILFKYDHFFLLVFCVAISHHLLFVSFAYLKYNNTIGSCKVFPVIQFYLCFDILQDPWTVVYLVYGILESSAEFIQKLGELRPRSVIGKVVRKYKHIILFQE